MRRFARLVPISVAIAMAVILAGCGGGPTLHADTEGVYLDLGQLKYQVELSRQLNPRDLEDRTYLQGLTPAESQLAPNQAWFSVWLLVENHTGARQFPAVDYRITDTQGNTYTPTLPGPGNSFAYHTSAIPPHGQIPALDTVAEASPIQGAVLLFKVRTSSYDNRPLVLSITDPSIGKTATCDLDV